MKFEQNGDYIWGYKKENDDSKVLRLPEEIRAIGINCFTQYDDTIESERLYIEEVVLPDKLEIIGRRAFMKLKSLKKVRIPDSLMVIEDDAFYSTAINFITLPDGLLYLGGCAFGETQIAAIRIPDKITSLKSNKISDGTVYGMFYRCGNLREISIPYALTEIGEGCFKYCKSLKKLVIRAPDGKEYSFQVDETLDTDGLAKLRETIPVGGAGKPSDDLAAIKAELMKAQAEQLRFMSEKLNARLDKIAEDLHKTADTARKLDRIEKMLGQILSHREILSYYELSADEREKLGI